MRQHLVSLLICTAAGLIGLAGCAKKTETVEPVTAAAPIPLNQFVRSWSSTPTLDPGDKIKELHPREDRIFAYTRAGQVLVMARDGGKLQWIGQIRSTDRGGMRPPVVMKEFVVLPTSSTLEVYDPNEGRFLRSIPLKVAARSNAIGWKNFVFLGGDFEGAGRVVSIEVTADYVHTVWQLMIPRGGLKSTPALFDETLYVGGGDGNVYAVAATNREPLWALNDNAFKTEGPIVADLGVDDTSVYVPSTDTRFYCLNRNTGKLKWQYFAGRPLTAGPIVAATQVYLPLPDGGIAAFSKTEGEYNRKPIWIAQGMTQFLAEDDKLVYLRRGGDNAIVAFEKTTGEQRFENTRRDLVVFATNTKPDGVIFAATKSNRILAIKPVLRPGVVGELVWNETDATDGAIASAQ
jgi:outer membrane protein assembly factor BamB